ncbi:hypothetical protein AB5N96_12545 [Chryseomicrobium imtechense]
MKSLVSFMYLLFVCLVLMGCASENQTSDSEYIEMEYEDVVKNVNEIDPSNNPIFDLISISITDFQIAEESEIENRLDFSFDIANISDKDIEISYLAYFPKELSQYYLSREKFDTSNGILEKNQLLKASLSTLVKNEDYIEKEEKDFIDQNGQFAYMVVRIDQEDYFLKFSLTE